MGIIRNEEDLGEDQVLTVYNAARRDGLFHLNASNIVTDANNITMKLQQKVATHLNQYLKRTSF